MLDDRPLALETGNPPQENQRWATQAFFRCKDSDAFHGPTYLDSGPYLSRIDHTGGLDRWLWGRCLFTSRLFAPVPSKIWRSLRGEYFERRDARGKVKVVVEAP